MAKKISTETHCNLNVSLTTCLKKSVSIPYEMKFYGEVIS